MEEEGGVQGGGKDSLPGRMTFSELKRSIRTLLEQGQHIQAAQLNEQYYGNLTAVQQQELEKLYQEYGY